MASTTNLKREWTLTEKAFDGLLLCLDPDRGRAALKYETLRLKLINLFRWNGINQSPEDLADETLDRVARKVDEGEEIKNIHAYVHRVASNVLKEAYRESTHSVQPVESLRPHQSPVYDPAESEHKEREEVEAAHKLECLLRCMQELPAETRRLITDYYHGEKGAKIAARKELAKREGVTAATLRLRAHHVRLKIEKCCERCLRRFSR